MAGQRVRCVLKESSFCVFCRAHESQCGMCISRRFREGCVLHQQSLLYFSLGKMATGYVRVQLLACVSSCAASSQCCHRLLVSVWVCSAGQTWLQWKVAAGLQLCVEVFSRISARTHSFISLSVDDETLPWQCYLLFPHWGEQTALRSLCVSMWNAGNNQSYIMYMFHAFLVIGFILYLQQH